MNRVLAIFSCIFLPPFICLADDKCGGEGFPTQQELDLELTFEQIKNLTTRQIHSLPYERLEKITAQELMEMSPEQLKIFSQSFLESKIPDFTQSDINKILNNKEWINHLPLASAKIIKYHLLGITPSDISRIPKETLRNLADRDINKLSAAQTENLTSEQIQILGRKIILFSKDQIQALGEKITALSLEQRLALQQVNRTSDFSTAQVDAFMRENSSDTEYH